MIKDVLPVDEIPSAQGAKISNVGNGNFQRRFSIFPTLEIGFPSVGFRFILSGVVLNSDGDYPLCAIPSVLAAVSQDSFTYNEKGTRPLRSHPMVPTRSRGGRGALS